MKLSQVNDIWKLKLNYNEFGATLVNEDFGASLALHKFFQAGPC